MRSTILRWSCDPVVDLWWWWCGHLCCPEDNALCVAETAAWSPESRSNVLAKWHKYKNIQRTAVPSAWCRAGSIQRRHSCSSKQSTYIPYKHMQTDKQTNTHAYVQAYTFTHTCAHAHTDARTHAHTHTQTHITWEAFTLPGRLITSVDFLIPHTGLRTLHQWLQ